MSKPRADACREPGPYGAHCTSVPGHRWSCYDDGADVSFNERQMREDEVPHSPCRWCDEEAEGA